jgi:hypothetical protein
VLNGEDTAGRRHTKNLRNIQKEQPFSAFPEKGAELIIYMTSEKHKF